MTQERGHCQDNASFADDDIRNPLVESVSVIIKKKEDNFSSEMLDAVQHFLNPLKQSILSSKNTPGIGEGEVPHGTTLVDHTNSKGPSHHVNVDQVELLKSLCQFIWDPNLMYTEKGFLQRCYNQLDVHFNMNPNQSDLDDLLDHKPSEIMAYKASQLFILLVLPNPSLFLKEIQNFKKLIEDKRIYCDGAIEAGCLFLLNIFQAFYGSLADEQVEQEKGMILSFQELPPPSQCVVHGLSVLFINLFKIKVLEKIRRMERVVQQDNSSVDWCLVLAEIWRLRRRDIGARNKWATSEEMCLLDKAISIAPENPFVRLTVLDTIIGSVRDSSGRFSCAGIYLDSMDDAMRYLHENCMKLTEDFPNNVSIKSIISDYFARYFPHLYFDPDRALSLLESGYTLNPSNPKTTHRFGILYRMSYGNCDESLKWLSKTIELDPTHFQATFEYYKTLLGKLDDYDVAIMMETTLTSASAGWNNFELSDFLFYLGIAHFAKGNKEKTLECWRECASYSEKMFSLEDILTTSENFQWNYKLVDIDKIKLWIQAEKSSLNELEKAGDSFDSSKKTFVDRLFSLMLGFTIPKRGKNRDHFPKKFPVQFYDVFAVEP